MAEADAKIPAHSAPVPKAIIVPHAGYIYSGLTAAAAYRAGNVTLANAVGTGVAQITLVINVVLATLLPPGAVGTTMRVVLAG